MTNQNPNFDDAERLWADVRRRLEDNADAVPLNPDGTLTNERLTRYATDRYMCQTDESVSMARELLTARATIAAAALRERNIRTHLEVMAGYTDRSVHGLDMDVMRALDEQADRIAALKRQVAREERSGTPPVSMSEAENYALCRLVDLEWDLLHDRQQGVSVHEFTQPLSEALTLAFNEAAEVRAAILEWQDVVGEYERVVDKRGYRFALATAWPKLERAKAALQRVVDTPAKRSILTWKDPKVEPPHGTILDPFLVWDRGTMHHVKLGGGFWVVGTQQWPWDGVELYAALPTTPPEEPS